MAFEVQQEFIYGWENSWSEEDGTPTTYETREQAQAGIDEFIKDEDEAYKMGNIESPYTADEFRIVEIANK